MTPLERGLRRDVIVLGALCLVCIIAFLAPFWWPPLALWVGRVVIGGIAVAFAFLAAVARHQARTGYW